MNTENLVFSLPLLSACITAIVWMLVYVGKQIAAVRSECTDWLTRAASDERLERSEIKEDTQREIAKMDLLLDRLRQDAASREDFRAFEVRMREYIGKLESVVDKLGARVDEANKGVILFGVLKEQVERNAVTLQRISDYLNNALPRQPH